MLDPLEEHYGYLADVVKRACYQAAISRVVRAGQVVMDLGCGSGLLGLMALRAGAGTVLFVDHDPVIEMARQTVIAAGFGDRARFYQSRSYDLHLPLRADVVLCDHVGYFGFDYDIFRLLSDARNRFLQPGGVMVPSRISLMLAPVESESSRAIVQRWCDGSVPGEYAWAARAAANISHPVTLQAGDLLAEPAELATTDLGTNAPDFLELRGNFACSRDATLDGLAGWFDCVLHGDVRMTNAPTAGSRLDRPQAFLPLERPVALRAGQRVDATIMARPHDNVIAWTVELPATGQQFRHSTFNGLVLGNLLQRMSMPSSGT